MLYCSSHRSRCRASAVSRIAWVPTRTQKVGVRAVITSRARVAHAGRAAIILITLGGLLASCGGSSGPRGPRDDKAINVLMVDNPQMKLLQKLTPEHFTKRTGVKVNFKTLPENELRERVPRDFAKRGGRYDVATVSNYEAPLYGKKGWLHPLDGFIGSGGIDDQQDMLLSMQLSLTGPDGRMYGQPFYGESSFLMYRKDVFKSLGLSMPDKPTWQQVADLAAKADGRVDGMKGICLRGLPGWGQMIAPLTTVVNTFGGTWFDDSWKARLDDPEFTKAVKFYVDLVREHGESKPTESGYTQCLDGMKHSKAAMWYDATAAAGELEADSSPVKGDIGYVKAPVEKTDSSGWLYTWAWGMQKGCKDSTSAWKFISWASSRKYEELVGEEAGWVNVPAGKRQSTYDVPEYRKAVKPFYQAVESSIREADPRHPGLQRRPAPGIQFVGIPEFADLGNRVSEELAAAIDGRQSIDEALENSQRMAERVGSKHKKSAE